MRRNGGVIFHDEFAAEVRQYPLDVRERLKAAAILLGEEGPLLGRTFVDTLKGSRHTKMKELRFDAGGGVWRVAFAFDPERKAVLLVGGDKGGVGQQRFYRNLIRIEDERFDEHLQILRSGKRQGL